MHKKTKARALAIQALYQLDLRGPGFLAEKDEFFRTSARDAVDGEIGARLFDGCVASRDELDARLAAVTEHWDVSRMVAVDRAILRLGAYELLHCPDVPPKVAVDEAIRLAKRFSTAESGAFVNGILDKLMGPAEAGHKHSED